MPAPMRAEPDVPALVRVLTILDASLTYVAAMLAPRDEDAMAARSLVT